MTIIKQAVKYICPACKKEVVNPKHVKLNEHEESLKCPHCDASLR